VFPGSGGPVRVTRRVGEGRAKEMIYFGEPIEPETALAWGLVNRVVPAGEALITARRMAAALAKGPVKALQLCKSVIDFSHDVSKNEAIERSLALSAEAFASADCHEGVRAFFEKREPRFTRS
jgi:enoyl-CoA hydratase